VWSHYLKVVNSHQGLFVVPVLHVVTVLKQVSDLKALVSALVLGLHDLV
jgi:hypothetical protein